MVWNGYDGHIYITSALTLPAWQPARILIEAQHTTNPLEKHWYPTLMYNVQCTVQVYNVQVPHPHLGRPGGQAGSLSPPPLLERLPRRPRAKQHLQEGGDRTLGLEGQQGLVTLILYIQISIFDVMIK